MNSIMPIDIYPDWDMRIKRQDAFWGKGVQITIEPDEIGLFMANLRPEGVWLSIRGLGDAVEAEAAI